MTDPLSERLEQAIDLCAANLHSHLGANKEWLKKQLDDYFTPILRDEIAAAEEAALRKAGELTVGASPVLEGKTYRMGERIPKLEAQILALIPEGNHLVRHDAAVRERTLEEAAGHVMRGYGAACSCGWYDKSRTCAGMTDMRQWQEHIRALKTPQPEVSK